METWSYMIGIILTEVLKDKYLEHFLKFVKGTMILCSDYITHSTLNYAEALPFVLCCRNASPVWR
jgi:hypothetical protein